MTRIGFGLRLACLLGVLAALAPLVWAAARLRHPAAGRLAVLFHRLFLRLFGIRVRVLGQPPWPGQPVLVLANHVSWLDIPVMASLQPLSFIAKSEIATWPLVGGLARLQRCVFIDRARKAATAEVNAVVGERLARGDVVVLFPEGTTGDGLRLLPFRSSLVGAARAALARPDIDGIRLQPLAIRYTRRGGLPVTRREMPDIAWYGDVELGPHVAAFARGGPLDVTIAWGEPIGFGPATDRKRATAAAEDAVRASLRLAAAGDADPPAACVREARRGDGYSLERAMALRSVGAAEPAGPAGPPLA